MWNFTRYYFLTCEMSHITKCWFNFHLPPRFWIFPRPASSPKLRRQIPLSNSLSLSPSRSLSPTLSHSHSPHSSFLSFFSLPLTHTHVPLFLPHHLFFSLFLSSHHRHSHTQERETEIEESVRERELCCQEEEEEEEKDGFLESSVQSASMAPIHDHPWSERAEIFRGSSQHVNLHCERWRSDLEQSAVIFYPVNSSSVLVRFSLNFCRNYLVGDFVILLKYLVLFKDLCYLLNYKLEIIVIWVISN